jgi:magnesium transporter
MVDLRHTLTVSPTRINSLDTNSTKQRKTAHVIATAAGISTRRLLYDYKQAAAMDTIPLSAGPITLGVTTAIITSLIQSLGLTLQRKSHVAEEARPPHQRRRPFRRGLWRLGLIIFLSSNILGSTVQITTLPLVILAPLQASGLIFNAVLASLILHEGFTRLSLLGTVLVSVGAGLIAGFGALEEPSHNLRELLDMFSRTPFIIWMGIQAGIVVVILVVSRVLLISIRRKAAVMDNAGLGFMAISSIAVGRSIKRLKIVRGCVMGCLSGLISAHCLLLAKTAVELVIRSITDQNQFSHWQSWMIVLCLLVLELAQVSSSDNPLKE